MRVRVLLVLVWCTSGVARAAHAPAIEPDEAAWRLFAALHVQPAVQAGQRDAPAVWERWPVAGEVFRPGGVDPGPWHAALAPSSDVRFETAAVQQLPNARHIVAGRMVALEDPLAGQHRLTDIHFNRASYDYIRARRLYAIDGQLEAARSQEGIDFPPDAVHVKAKWRPIREEERGRYHTLSVRLADGTSRLYGLTGLHVASKQRPLWLWATFEHVDNATRADGEGWQLPSRDRFACAGRASDCNDVPRGLGLATTVWSNYRLRGTMIRFVDAAQRPERLANSELEMGFQASSSCITCHSRSAVGMTSGVIVRPAVLQDATSEDGLLARRGFVGAPQAAWFAIAGSTARLDRLDFVWSLMKAQGTAP